MRSFTFWLSCFFAIAVWLPSGAAAQSCAAGTVTAEYSLGPEFPGMYKYCVEVQWELGRYEASHLDVFLALGVCPCICDPRFIRLAFPAGHSVNTSDAGWSCELDYVGDYVCKGDPSLPTQMDGPAVKFQPDPLSGCSPGVKGYGTFCFYSPMPPRDPAIYPQGLAIKHGRETCYGMLEGQMPSCDCAVPAQSSTWGALKAVYR